MDRGTWWATDNGVAKSQTQLRDEHTHMILLLFILLLCVYFCRPFLSFEFPVWRSFFSICCNTGLLVLSSVNFCLSVKLLISLLNLDEIFAG